MRHLVLALMLMAVAGAPRPVVAQAQQDALPYGGAEMLRFQAPAGWGVVHTDEGEALRVLHMMPEGQQPGDWRDMITVQVLKTTEPPTLAALHARAVASYEADCEQRLGGTPQYGDTNGFETAFWTLGCSRNRRTGHGETAFFKAVRGLEGVYVLQRAWRVAPFDPAAGPGISAEDQRLAVSVLQGATVCIPDSRAHPCP